MRQTILDVFSNVLSIEFERRIESERVANLISRLRPREIQGGLLRFGGLEDGAYLIPAALIQEIDGCISPGVGNTIEFEESLYRSLGVKTLLVDPKGDNISRYRKEFIHVKKLLKGTKSIDEDSVSLSDLVAEYFPTQHNMILQIDIEGSEYGSLLTTSEQLLNRFLIVVIEFHDLNRWKKRVLFENFYEPAVSKLLKTHIPVHLHPNRLGGTFRLNKLKLPCVVESTLVRRDFMMNRDSFASLPNPLDIDINSSQKIVIDFKALFKLAKIL